MRTSNDRRNSRWCCMALLCIMVVVTACAGPTPNGKTNVNDVWSMDGKCQTVLDWYSKFEAEYPGASYNPRRDLAAVANLYRDNYFVPVFGFPYDSANAMKLREIDVDVLHQCYGLTNYRTVSASGLVRQIKELRAPSQEIIKKVRPLKQFFDLGFNFNPQLAAIVAERRKVEQWMEEVVTYTDRLEPTQENLRELEETYIRTAKRDLVGLWPSEQRAFLERLEARKRVFAQALPAPSPTPAVKNPTPAPDAEAHAWFEEGMKYEFGYQKTKDYTEAARLYDRAASRGFAPAQAQLGYLYQTGTGVAEDARKAFDLYTKAAESGDKLGQFRLAVAYINGIGTARDASAARHWLTKAAESGGQQAQLMLGLMLQQGAGGDKNEFAARRWLLKAAAGLDKSIAEKARSIQEKIDERVLFSGAFRGDELAFLALVGFGLVAVMASSDSGSGYTGGTDGYAPKKYAPFSNTYADCMKKPPELFGACLHLGGW